MGIASACAVLGTRTLSLLVGLVTLVYAAWRAWSAVTSTAPADQVVRQLVAAAVVLALASLMLLCDLGFSLVLDNFAFMAMPSGRVLFHLLFGCTLLALDPSAFALACAILVFILGAVNLFIFLGCLTDTRAYHRRQMRALPILASKQVHYKTYRVLQAVRMFSLATCASTLVLGVVTALEAYSDSCRICSGVQGNTQASLAIFAVYLVLLGALGVLGELRQGLAARNLQFLVSHGGRCVYYAVIGVLVMLIGGNSYPSAAAVAMALLVAAIANAAMAIVVKNLYSVPKQANIVGRPVPRAVTSADPEAGVAAAAVDSSGGAAGVGLDAEAAAADGVTAGAAAAAASGANDNGQGDGDVAQRRSMSSRGDSVTIAYPDPALTDGSKTAASLQS